MKTGLYLHIPFCKQKCNYCDFASFAGRESFIPAYLAALASEAARSPVKTFQTLYVGGGTPSLLSLPDLQKLTGLVEHSFGPVAQFEESTLEANPESLTPQKLHLLKQAGFNRLSIGLQSWHDNELKTLGRVHTQADFVRGLEAARRAGFENISVDLIAGVPGQSLASFLGGLKAVLALGPEHISVYGLQIEQGTPFFERGIVCDQLLMRRMLEESHFLLTRAGFHHYEISNFARPGREAKHNTHYWQYGEYVGLGSAAASFLNGRRSQNTPDPVAYVRCIETGADPVDFAEHLQGIAREGEKLMLALRQLDGVVLTPQQERLFGRELARHVQKGLLLQEGKKVKLSFEGLFLANEVFCSFVAPFEQV